MDLTVLGKAAKAVLSNWLPPVPRKKIRLSPLWPIS